MNTAPPLLVKPAADGIDYWILRADVDIEAGSDVTQCPPEQNILKFCA